MFCYQCGAKLSEQHDFCTACGVDVYLYKKIMYVSNRFYNEGLEKASVRDLSGAVVSLRQSLKFNKNHIEARNLLGLVYFEMGEVVAAMSEWVISKNLRPEKNIADDYIFIRYMGPKFVIMFCGAEVSGVEDFIKDIKQSVEKLEIKLYEDDEIEENKKSKKTNQVVKPKLNFVMGSYYKGTGLEEVLKKLEDYLDNADKAENNITTI